MSVICNFDDRYCPEGHVWIKVPNSTLFQDCYYCLICDKIYGIMFKEYTKDFFKKNYHSDRFNDIKQFALLLQAKEKVTKEDLIKLGYLK